MKNLSLIIITISMSLFSCAQNISNSQAPAVVLNTFQTMYPKATDVEWKKKGSLYQVEFETGLSGVDHKMLIDSTGKVTYHKVDITENDLPQLVKASLAKNFPGFKVDDLDKITSLGVVSYKIEVKKKPEEWKITFDAEGKIIDKIAD